MSEGLPIPEINNFLIEAFDIVGLPHIFLQYKSGIGLDTRVRLHSIKEAKLSDEISLYDALYNLLVSIHMRIQRLQDDIVNNKYHNLIPTYWKKWKLNPVPITINVSPIGLGVILFTTLAIPLEDIDEVLEEYPQSYTENIYRRMKSKTMPTGYTLSEKESIYALSNIMTLQILGVEDSVTEIKNETSGSIEKISSQSSNSEYS